MFYNGPGFSCIGAIAAHEACLLRIIGRKMPSDPDITILTRRAGINKKGFLL